MRTLTGTEPTKKQQPSSRSSERDWREYNLEGQKPTEGQEMGLEETSREGRVGIA